MRPAARTATLALLATLSWSQTWAAQEPVPYESFSQVPVASVTAEGAKLSAEELRQAAPFSEGDPFSPSLLAQGIRNLYRTGRFRQVRALARIQDGRLAVRLVLEPKRQVRRFLFNGNLRVSEAELRRLIALGLESDATVLKLDAAASRMREHYAFRGFKSADVSYEILPPERGRSDVVFSIREGRRDLVTDILLDAEPGFSRTRLLSIISMAPGDPFDGRALDRDTARVTGRLKDDGFFFPEVLAEARDDGSGRLVTFRIRRNGRFTFKVDGESGSARRRLVGWIAEAFRSADSTEKAMQEAEKRVRGDYLARGHSFVSLEWKRQADSRGLETVTLKVVPGRPSVIGSVRVEGAAHFSAERLDAILNLPAGKPFVRSRVDEAVASLEKQYRFEGYEAAAVKLLPLNFVQEPLDGPMSAQVQITVTEGKRQTIGQVTVEGGPFDREKVLKIIGVSPGGPYSADLLLAGRNELVTALTRQGYAYASVSAEPAPPRDGERDLRILIEEGPLLRVDRIVLSGNERTKEQIVRLAMGIDPGQPLTTQDMLDAKERIYDLRVFQSAEIRVADPEEPGTPKDLFVDLVERPRYVFGLRVGYGNEDHLRGEASITDRNVGQMARALSLRARASDIERFVSLTYGHPWYLGRRMDFTASLSDQVEQRESYTRDALSATVNVTRRVSDRTTFNLGYSFEGLRLLDVSPGAQLSPDDVGKTDLATVHPELIYDSRDDVLDPSSGMLGDLKLELAWKGLGSEAEYAKAELAHRRYLPLGGGLVGAAMVRAGLVRSYGKSSEVIISKRFFLGGFNSVRGYSLDGVGPKDADGDPVGGNFMVNTNLEVRYPIRHALRGIVFVDTGGLWLERQSYADEALRASVGAGLRWSSPIGPFSLDYGYKVNPSKADEKDRYRVHFSIGQAF